MNLDIPHFFRLVSRWLLLASNANMVGAEIEIDRTGLSKVTVRVCQVPVSREHLTRASTQVGNSFRLHSSWHSREWIDHESAVSDDGQKQCNRLMLRLS